MMHFSNVSLEFYFFKLHTRTPILFSTYARSKGRVYNILYSVRIILYLVFLTISMSLLRKLLGVGECLIKKIRR